MRTYIGIDNGVTGAIAYVNDDVYGMISTPTFEQLNYTKIKSKTRRLDVNAFEKYILELIERFGKNNLNIILERPMVNPGRFKATISAVRCLEATLIVLEKLKLSYRYIDSKEWQKVMLPGRLKATELKWASQNRGCVLFPDYQDMINVRKDADALLMAEYARMKKL